VIRDGRAGTTLLELLVTIAVIGVIATVVVIAVPPDRTVPETDALVQVARARTQAIEEARPRTISILVAGRPLDITALPDGSVIADPSLGLDRLSGRAIDDRR
jgi:prepilin-type N-terminal cleavage/methylation domain-containing protein